MTGIIIIQTLGPGCLLSFTRHPSQAHNGPQSIHDFIILTNHNHFHTGNHAGALALAAKERGVPCYVVMVRAPHSGHLLSQQTYSIMPRYPECGTSTHELRRTHTDRVAPPASTCTFYTAPPAPTPSFPPGSPSPRTQRAPRSTPCARTVP